MAFEIPKDLIQQVQIALRNEVGLSGYDPYDATLPPLPSIDSSIAGLDPSAPAYLRCKKCKGKLLRGIQSLICIYCGTQQQNKDLPPDPISFTSTFGYQWLLQSLDLDQSETVGPSTEKSESNRGLSTPEQEISLHDLLNLQITWSEESGKVEESVASKTLEQSSSSLNLNGADFESKRDIVYGVSAEPVVSKQIESTESKASVGEENLSLFSSVPSVADSADRSNEDNSGDTFSGWTADFQSANKDDGSKSFEPFISSSVDLSSHMDSVSGPGNDQKAGKLEDDSIHDPSMAYDWMQDDLWKNVNSKMSQQADPFDSSEARDGPMPNNFSSSEGIDWFEDNQDLQSANKHKDSKSFDPFLGSNVDLSSHLDSVFGSGKDLKAEKLEDDSRPGQSTSYDWMQDDLLKFFNSKVSQQDEHFDSNVEAKGGSPPDNLKHSSTEGIDWFEDNQCQTNITSAPSSKTIDEHSDSFDEWNDFTSSTSALDPFGNAWKESDNPATNEHTSEINLFGSTSNLQDNEFGSVSKSNLFSGSYGIQNSASVTNDILSKFPASDRIDNAPIKVEEAPGIGVDIKQTTEPKDDVETLMSQMHDLSFMLETDLSLPSKLYGPTSTPQD